MLIAGEGALEEKLQTLIEKLGVADRIKLLSFRTDIAELNTASDFFAFASIQEGLPVALMEAMARGLPVVCSRIRGNVDLIDDGVGGILFDPHSVNECKVAIQKCLLTDKQTMGSHNKEKIKNFSTQTVITQMQEIYERL